MVYKEEGLNQPQHVGCTFSKQGCGASGDGVVTCDLWAEMAAALSS